MVQIFTLLIIISRIFIMSKEFPLTLVIKLRNLFSIINETYESLKSKNDH